MPEINKLDLLNFIYSQQKKKPGLRFRELMDFCNCDPKGKRDEKKPAKVSYGTLMKYKNELTSEGLMNKKIDPESGRPVYRVTGKGKKAVDKYRMKAAIDSLPEQLLDPFEKLWVFIKKVEPNRALDTFCFTFVGNTPIAFGKSVEALQDHLEFEEKLRRRYNREFAKLNDELKALDSGDKLGQARIRRRISKEVGWTFAEYLKKQPMTTEKEVQCMRRKLISLGMPKELLEEMPEDAWLSCSSGDCAQCEDNNQVYAQIQIKDA